MLKKMIISLLCLVFLVGFGVWTPWGQILVGGEVLAGDSQMCLSGKSMLVEIKWGNVSGRPHNREQMSFDGEVSVSDGTMSLIKTLRFEEHDQTKDQIISEQNPVSWKSWIFKKWDGVMVQTLACSGAELSVKTDQGSLIIPISKLENNKQPVVLKFNDGREIVVRRVKLTHEPPVPLVVEPEPICINHPGPDFCAGGIADLITTGVDENGCAIWACKTPAVQPECQNFPPPGFCSGGIGNVVSIGTDENGCAIWGCKNN